MTYPAAFNPQCQIALRGPAHVKVLVAWFMQPRAAYRWTRNAR